LWGAEYNGAYPSISSFYELLDESLLHMWRGRTSSCSRATFPTLSLADACCCRTSWKLLNVVRYSLCHRLQKSSASFCRSLNSFASLPFVSSSGPVGIAVSLLPMRKCAGVNPPDSSLACTVGPGFRHQMLGVVTRSTHKSMPSLLIPLLAKNLHEDMLLLLTVAFT